jgi:hypothetical protein
MRYESFEGPLCQKTCKKAKTKAKGRLTGAVKITKALEFCPPCHEYGHLIFRRPWGIRAQY